MLWFTVTHYSVTTDSHWLDVTSPMMLLIDCHWNDVLPSELTTMLCSPDLLLVSSPRFESVTVYLNNQCWAGVNGGWWRWFYGPITVRGRQNILELNIKRLMGPNIKCFSWGPKLLAAPLTATHIHITFSPQRVGHLTPLRGFWCGLCSWAQLLQWWRGTLANNRKCVCVYERERERGGNMWK